MVGRGRSVGSQVLNRMKNVSLLVIAAVGLIIIWIVATVTRFLAGVLLNLLLVAAVILLIIWAVRRIR